MAGTRQHSTGSIRGTHCCVCTTRTKRAAACAVCCPLFLSTGRTVENIAHLLFCFEADRMKKKETQRVTRKLKRNVCLCDFFLVHPFYLSSAYSYFSSSLPFVTLIYW